MRGWAPTKKKSPSTDRDTAQSIKERRRNQDRIEQNEQGSTQLAIGSISQARVAFLRARQKPLINHEFASLSSVRSNLSVSAWV